MTATAIAEIALLDFEAAVSSREVGDLLLADWGCSPPEDVLSQGDPREGQYVVVVPGGWGEEPAAKRTLTLPRAALVQPVATRPFLPSSCSSTPGRSSAFSSWSLTRSGVLSLR